MRELVLAFLALLSLLTQPSSGHATVCDLPPVYPILPGSDHSHERHIRSSGTFPEDDYSFQRFDGANLTHACFDRTDMVGSSLRNVTANGLIVQDLSVAGADFSNADLQGARFIRVDGFEAVFDGADLSGGIFWSSEFVGASFDGADLTDAQIGSGGGVSFSYATFFGARLANVGLPFDADFSGADLRQADLTGFASRGILNGADLRGARLTDAYFSGPMIGANLVGADVEGARLSHELRGAILDGLVLTDVLPYRGVSDLRWASLRNADLRRAIRFRTRFEGADLRGADLRDNGDRFAYFNRFTLYDLTTRFSEAFDPVAEEITLHGDNNDDSVVDIEDLNNVRNHFGDVGVVGIPGDTVFDGVVDIDDFNAVLNAFGTRAVAPVPEPPGWCLLMMAVASVAVAVRRRRQ